MPNQRQVKTFNSIKRGDKTKVELNDTQNSRAVARWALNKLECRTEHSAKTFDIDQNDNINLKKKIQAKKGGSKKTGGEGKEKWLEDTERGGTTSTLLAPRCSGHAQRIWSYLTRKNAMLQAKRKPQQKPKAGNYWNNSREPSFCEEEENQNLCIKQQKYDLDNKRDPPKE